ncbi:protein kinase domain-containing protein [Actinomadura rubrisoli]|uniref:Protein kinase n=1 Tax=Actinomadura rubrisoli TaxID=2530368 RepID=A0A4R5B859_9ACTN|nr:protein kinase [Actinomadura rubrisoli]TDD79864.1 protein kinase [Actinomadura rubrisoli]
MTRGDGLLSRFRGRRSKSAAPDDGIVWRTGEVVLGTYRIGEELGAGGMGVVHRVRHSGWNQDLAVKSPRPALWESGITAFVDEAEVWVNLPPHPHLCVCHYVRVLGGAPRIFAEYVPGGTVAEALRAGRLADLAGILDAAIQMAWGLDAAHEAGVVHQDVKPANALRTPDGHVKITDFGLARGQARAGTAVRAESILATHRGMTPAYASPEQAEGQRVGRAGDVWSWAVSVLEMFTGEVTWMAGPAAAEALDQYLAEGPAPGRTAMPADVAELLRECFAADPSARPAGLGALADRLISVYRTHVGAHYPREASGSVSALADGLNNKALSLMDLGRTDQADEAWRQALDADPRHMGATFNRRLAQWRSGRITDLQLLDHLERFRFSLPDSDARLGRTAYLMGVVHLERGDIPAAVELLDQATPDDPEVTAARDAAAAQEAEERPPLRLDGHDGTTCPLAFSADGRNAVSGGDDRTVRMWNLAAGHCLQTLTGHTGGVTSVALASDERQAFSGALDGTVRVWDLHAGRCLRTLTADGDVPITTVAPSQDGRHVLSGDRSGTLRWWDATTGRCLHTMTGHRGAINAVAVTRDARRALSAGEDGTVCEWDLDTGGSVSTIAGHTEAVHAIVLTPEEDGFLSGGSDGTIRFWGLADGRCRSTFTYPHKFIEVAHPTIRSVTISPDGRQVLAGDSDGAVTWWDLTTGRCLRTFSGHDDAVGSLAIAAHERTALSSGRDNTVRRWDLASGSPAPWTYSRPQSPADLGTQAESFQNGVDRARSLLDDGDHRAALDELRRARTIPGFENNAALAKLWRQAGRGGRRTTALGARQTRRLSAPSQLTKAVAITPNARYALSTSMDAAVQWWDLTTGDRLRNLPGHDGFVFSLAITPDARRAVSVSTDRTLRWWDLSTGRCRATLTMPTDEPLFAVALTGNGRRALSGGADGVLRWWDLAGGRCLHSLTDSGSIGSVAVTPDGGRGLSAAGGVLRWWDLDEGRCLTTFTDPKGEAGAVAVTPDGRIAVSGTAGGDVHVWDPSTGEHLHTLTGHTAQINNVAVTEDGRHALSGGEDATLRWWDLVRGRLLHQVKTTYVASVAMTLDGHHAVSGTPDGSVLVWEVDWDYDFPPG